MRKIEKKIQEEGTFIFCACVHGFVDADMSVRLLSKEKIPNYLEPINISR